MLSKHNLFASSPLCKEGVSIYRILSKFRAPRSTCALRFTAQGSRNYFLCAPLWEAHPPLRSAQNLIRALNEKFLRKKKFSSKFFFIIFFCFQFALALHWHCIGIALAKNCFWIKKAKNVFLAKFTIFEQQKNSKWRGTENRLIVN